MSKHNHDKDEQAKPGSAQAEKPVVPGSAQDKENLKHEHEQTRTEHEPVSPTTFADDDRTDGQRQRDEQLRTGGIPQNIAAAPGQVTDEQRKNVKVNTPPDSPLVVPTNNADPPVAATPWNPLQGQAAQGQQQQAEDLQKVYQDPQKEADKQAEQGATKQDVLKTTEQSRR